MLPPTLVCINLYRYNFELKMTVVNIYLCTRVCVRVCVCVCVCLQMGYDSIKHLNKESSVSKKKQQKLEESWFGASCKGSFSRNKLARSRNDSATCILRKSGTGNENCDDFGLFQPPSPHLETRPSCCSTQLQTDKKPTSVIVERVSLLSPGNGHVQRSKALQSQLD